MTELKITNCSVSIKVVLGGGCPHLLHIEYQLYNNNYNKTGYYRFTFLSWVSETVSFILKLQEIITLNMQVLKGFYFVDIICSSPYTTAFVLLDRHSCKHTQRHTHNSWLNFKIEQGVLGWCRASFMKPLLWKIIIFKYLNLIIK